MPTASRLHLPLDELLELLAAQGFYLGIDTHLRLQSFLQRFSQRSEVDLDILGFQLSALLSHSAEQQDLFQRIFHDFVRPFAQATAMSETVLPEQPNEAAPLPTTPIPAQPIKPAATVSPAENAPQPVATAGRSGPIRVELHFPANPLRIWNTTELDQAVRPLREKEWTLMQEWDVKASIMRTIRSGGIPTFEMRLRKKPPQYLLLIDQKSPRDHLAALYAELAIELNRRDITAEYFFYDSVPYRCWKDRRDPHTVTTLEGLQSEYAGYKLLIIGETEGLLDLHVLQPSNLAIDLRENWAQVALLCSKPTSTWGNAELALCQLFPVVPANAAGINSLTVQWGASEVFSPDYWKSVSPESPVPETRLERPQDAPEMVEEVQYYLGRNGFQWLCAAAVYPEIYWELTALLHDESIPPDAAANEQDMNRVWWVALLRLSRLRWFRQGAIPAPAREHLRRLFDDKLPLALRQAVRRQLIDVLDDNPLPSADSYAAASRAFTIAWLDYERNVVQPGISEEERTQLATDFREQTAATVALSDIEDAVGRKLFENLQATNLQAENGTKFRVLWVDDHPENNAGISNSLVERGMLVDTALSTEEALEKLAQQNYQVVLSDLGRGNSPEAGLDMLLTFKEKGIQIATGIYTMRKDDYPEKLLAVGAAVVSNNGPEIENWVLGVFAEWEFAQQVPADPVRPGLQVLWVDDEPENNARFQDELNELLHAIFTNTVGTAAALEYLARSYFDVIVSDISRHGDNEEGKNMLRAFRERNVAVPVVFYTTPPMVDRYSAELREMGAAGVFSSKPEVRTYLGERVRAKQQQTTSASNAPPDNPAYSQSQPPADPSEDPRITAAQKAEDEGKAALETQNYEAATGAYQTALALFTELNDEAGRANTHQALGKISVATGRLEEALQHFRSASTGYLLLDFQPAYAYSLMNEGSVQQQLQQLEAAQKSYEEALEILEELGDAENEVEVHLALGRLAYDQKNYERAMRSFENGLQQVADLSNNDVEADLRFNLALAYQAIGNLEGASTELNVASGIYKALGNEKAVAEIEKLLLEAASPTVPSTRIDDEIQRLVSEGRTEDALDSLIQADEKTALILKAQYTRGRKDFLAGLLDFDEWQKIQARVNAGVLDSAKSLYTAANSTAPSPPKQNAPDRSKIKRKK